MLVAGCTVIGFGFVLATVADHPAYVTMKSDEKLKVSDPSAAVEVTVNGTAP